MSESLGVIANVAVLVFVVSCMAAAGLGLRPGEVVAPLRRLRLVALALIANFVVAPALAYALVELVRLDTPYATGLLLLGAAAGAPFLPKLAELVRGDVAFSVGLMVLLLVASVVFLPIALPLLVRGATVDTWPILRPLLFTMLVPLAAAMVLRGRSDRWASRLQPVIAKASNISLVAAVALLIGINGRALVGTFGSGAAATAVVYVALLIAVGYALGGPSLRTRSVLGLGTGQRNVAAALIIAANNFPDPRVVVTLLVATLAGLIPLVYAAIKLRPRPEPAPTAAALGHAPHAVTGGVGSSRVDLQACKLEYSIVSPK